MSKYTRGNPRHPALMDFDEDTARLYEAAPDLLEALKLCRAYIGGLIADPRGQKAYSVAGAAIVKAEGQE